jgi:Protein of unknown function (DUF3105)
LRIRHPGAWIAAGTIIFALFFLLFVVRILDKSAGHSKNHPPYPAEYGVQMFDDEAAGLPVIDRHVQPGQSVQYNSNPPTNGRHSGAAAPWGVSSTPVPKELAVHNMEHGGVIIWYNCHGGPQPLDQPACDQLRQDLTDEVDSRVDDGMYIVLTPYAEMDNRIALTAWQYLDAFDEFNEARIEAFIASFECKFDPENACR